MLNNSMKMSGADMFSKYRLKGVRMPLFRAKALRTNGLKTIVSEATIRLSEEKIIIERSLCKA